MRVRSIIPILTCIAAVCLAPWELLAQDGRIVGIITDSTGAVAPAVAVTTAHEATNVTRRFVTDTSGSFDFPGLPPGDYIIRAELAEFKVSVARVLVEVAQTIRRDLALAVGQFDESVTVCSAAAAPLLQTDSAEIGQVITTQEI